MALEVDENYEFQVRSWRVQRFGWVGMCLVIGAALAGFIGPGPLGDRTLTSNSGLQLRYDRFVRYEAPASMEIQLRAGSGSRAEFWIEGPWLESVHVETIVPEPERVVVKDGRMLVAIAAAAGESVHAIVHFEADTWGALSGAVGALGDPGLSIEQFAYP